MVSGMVYVPGMHEANAFERVSDIMDRAGIIVPGAENIQANNMQEIHISTLPGAEVSVSSTPDTAEQEAPTTAAPDRAGIVGRMQPGFLGRRDRSLMSSSTEGISTFTLGERRGSSSRSIIIHRGDETLYADMLRFIKLGDLDANPYVNSGDHIEVPQYAGNITVYGQVHDQGIYEFKEGDRICDLILFGGGLTSVADTSNAELIRFEPDGLNFQRISIDLNDAINSNPGAPLYRLRESDRLNVKRKYEYKVLYDVSIDGEVINPGQYAIKRNVSTLTELIELAGGFTGKENLEEARLIRRTSYAARDMEYERLKNLLVTERTAEENDYVRSYQRTFEGSVNIDFVRLFKENDFSYDIVLQDGDAVIIPTIKEYVNVIGAVREPGYFKVQESADMKYYIEKAGGYNWDADKRERSLIKARTSQRYKTRFFEVEIEGGDTIHIPARVPRTFWSYFREYSGYATSVATIILIAMQVSN
jgi:protein involved in polysaccharide export with SLBB domain